MTTVTFFSASKSQHSVYTINAEQNPDSWVEPCRVCVGNKGFPVNRCDVGDMLQKFLKPYYGLNDFSLLGNVLLSAY